MNIMKIKYNSKGKVEIEYEKNDRETDSKKTTFTSFDEPLDSFKQALQNLAQFAEEICELPDGFLTAEAIVDAAGQPVDFLGTVSGVSYSYSDKDGIMGATITVLRKLATAQAPLVINTPHLPEMPYTEGAEQPTLTWACVVALRHLQDEAAKYMAGERAEKQPELFETGMRTVNPEIALAVADMVPKNGSVTIEYKPSGWLPLDGPAPEPITFTSEQADKLREKYQKPA